MKLLLDTNAYSEFSRGSELVANVVRAAEQIVFSSIVVGELLYGFRAGTRFKQNLELLEGFLRNPLVSLVPVTYTTADRFGRIAAGLRARGTAIPSNDIWIAAHAFETGAELATLDSHFARVEGLPLVWP